MLAMADKDGLVSASVPGLATLARTSVEKCEEALVTLSSPDRYSRTREFEGRRIKEVEGGWQLLNYDKYRRKLSAEERREYLAAKQREYRARDKKLSTNVDNVSDTDTRLTQADSDSKADTEARKTFPQRKALGSHEFHAFWAEYPRKVAKLEAVKAWMKGVCDGSLGEILAGLEAWKRTNQWADLEAIPYPATWITGQRWKETPERGRSKNEQKSERTKQAIERVRAELGG